MERALLVIVKFDSDKDVRQSQEAAKELIDLATTSHAEVIDQIICHRDKPTANLYIGSGKAEEIALTCQEKEIATVIFNDDLSGTQQKNLEGIIKCKIIDRTQLILDIFAQHAHSPEGKMQVELAQMEYLFPRLTGKGIMLSNLGGGIGTRGPGETKLEVDRRKIRRRIMKLKKDLGSVIKRRQIVRKKREKSFIPTVALIGYTNAGKSTLLNSLTHSEQQTRESLFTTLDPVSRMFTLPNNHKIIFSDTVGFLHRLPHHLIEAFKATLEEVKESDLLVHILDISHPQAYERTEAVYKVLEQLESKEKPMITALNKIDRLEDKGWLERYRQDFPNSVAISALRQENLEELIDKIMECLPQMNSLLRVIIPHEYMHLVNLIYEEGEVKKVDYTEKGVYIEVYLPYITANKILSYDKVKEVF